LTIDCRIRAAARDEKTRNIPEADIKDSKQTRSVFDWTAKHLPLPHFQVIKFYNDSIHTLLAGFDVDICSFAFDGTNVLAM